jgi:4'-phosphopantetheinyl transferase
MELYAADCRDFASRREEALARLPEERRRAVLARPRPDDALRALTAGLLLERFAGPGPYVYGPFGKPSLPEGPCFSLSHSGDLAVLAVDVSPVGADTEPADRPWRPETARRVLTAAEQRHLAGRGAEEFPRLWTRKEAVMKACGRGLALPASSFSVLDDAVLLPDRSTYYLKTLCYVNYYISVAASVPSEIRLIPVGPDILLDQEASHGDQDQR